MEKDNNKRSGTAKKPDKTQPQDEQKAESPKETSGQQNQPDQKSETDLLKDEIAILNEQLKAVHDKYLRALAEMDNLRKRMDKERAEFSKYGAEPFLHDLLPIFDGFTKVISPHSKDNDSKDFSSFIAGIQLVQRQFDSLLSKHGVVPILAQGQAFDPSKHQAIQKIESEDVRDEVVKDEFQAGYKLFDRLLRPAIVSVLVPKEVAKEKNKDEQSS